MLFSFSKANSQVILCDSLVVSGSQYQFTISINTSFIPILVDYWVTTSNSGFVLAEDSMSSSHVVFNNPATAFDTITTCLHYMNTVCCVIYIWDGSSWVSPTNLPTASWDCSPNSPLGCYDPGTGMGQYTSLSACQSVCGQVSNITPCDSINIIGSQSQFTMQPFSNLNMYQVDYIFTTSSDGTVLGEDSCFSSVCIHSVNNFSATTNIPYDTITTCLYYISNNSFNTFTCCETWIWNSNFGIWSKVGSITSTNHFLLSKNKLVKIVDVLGKKANHTINKTLFYIYEGGRVEKKYIYE